VAGTGDGDLFVLDSASLGGADHRTPLARARAGGPLRGCICELGRSGHWRSVDLRACAERDRGIQARAARRPAGAVAGLGIERDRRSGGAGGGERSRVWSVHGHASRRATLYILDAATGKPLFTSGDAVTGTANPETGLAVANGRVYFSTIDNTVYSFGIPTEH
jgi:hypothetical protein